MRETTEHAIDLAMRALAYISANTDLAGAFLGSAGIGANELRTAAKDPGFAVFVLDFLVQDDQRIIDFAKCDGIAPAEVMRARTLLAGPGGENWSLD